MARVKCILQNEFPYNVSARCINREWFQLSMDEVWQIFCEELRRTIDDHGLVVHSFVLMSNHFHLIASTPNSNISQCMQQFMHRSSKRLTRRGNRINQTFSGRHYKCVMQTTTYFLNAYKYNYRNPVAAGICGRVEDYEYSTLQFVLGRRKPLFPLVEDETYRCDPEETLAWLNTAPDATRVEAYRCGIRRQFFRSKKCKVTNRPILGPNDLL